jgi:small-conductance mechanosensitive channel
MTPDQYIQSLQVKEPPIQTYEVDNMSADELFCIDLLDKVGSENITDEELQQALDNAKQNASLFSKQVASLRVYYKDLEQKRQQQQEIEQQEAAEQQFHVFSENIINSIRNFNSFEDTPVELTYEEMEDLANYILTRDDSGYSEFGRLLNDPVQFTKAAFWMLKGPEILNEMQNKIKEAYLRGYNETHKTETHKRVFTKPAPQPANRNNNKEPQFAYFDEDSYLND